MQYYCIRKSLSQEHCERPTSTFLPPPNLSPLLSSLHVWLKLLQSHTALFWRNQREFSPSFPYKGPNRTGSSLQLNTCWVSCLSGGLRLKTGRAKRERHSPSNTHREQHTCADTQIQTVYKHIFSPHISVLNTDVCTCAQVFAYPWVAPHTQTWPQRGEGQDSVFSCQLSVCSLLLLLDLLVFAGQALKLSHSLCVWLSY